MTEFPLFWLVGVLLFAFWLWMLVDCLTNPSLQGTKKLIWVLVVIFLHALGALIYFLTVKNAQTQ